MMKEVLFSAAEAELGALFYNSKEACPLHTALTKIGHLQNATTIITNNSTAAGSTNNAVKQRRSKAIDMRLYWVWDCVSQGQFTVIWKKGKPKFSRLLHKTSSKIASCSNSLNISFQSVQSYA
jgi:hypothetical protein